MSPPPAADAALPAGAGDPPITIRRLEWEPDEQLSSRTWAYTALLDGRPLAVQAVVFRPDRSLLYLTPDLKSAAIPPGIAAADILRILAERVQHDLSPLDLVFQQAVIEPGDELGAIALGAAGFRPITDVCELSTEISPDSSSERAPSRTSGLELAAPPIDSPLWASAFAASLQGGLDMPELLEIRSAADSFGSLQLLAAGDTEHWRVAFRGDELAGLVLPTPLPDGTAEIQYLGVAPSHRRQGIGRYLVDDAMEAAEAMAAAALSVHVDIRNDPALRLYESCGFRHSDQRQLWLR